MDPRVGGFSSPHLPAAPQIAEVRNLSRFGILPRDTASLRASISVANLEVSRYNTEIDRLQTELDRLTSERDALASFAGFCRSALSPVHRMPNELLACIFKWCFPHQAYSVLGPMPQTFGEKVDHICHRHLLKLSRVCFRWHCAVMENPQLWSHIAIDTHTWDKCDVPVTNLLRMVEASLDRGKLFEVLSKHAPRWQEAIIWAVDGSNGFQTCAGKLLQLRAVTLFGKWKHVEIFRTAPLLQEGVANVESLSARLSLLPLLTSATEANLLLDLRKSSQIDEPLDLAINSTVQCIHFELATTARSATTACRFLENLTFPCLRSFCLYPPIYYNNPPVWNSSRFISLAIRSGFGSRLTQLLVHAIVTDAELLRCLEVLPKLESLSITDSPGATQMVISDLLLTQLQCMSDTRSQLVPELQVLTLKTVLAFTDSVYVDLLFSRAESEGGRMFVANLWWLKAREREVAVETFEKVMELTTRRALTFNRGDWNINVRLM
ncbi:hypothetical protein R3P38DRAFT_3253194 [Favolaschia claudopus]|uniref:F-box domain-containing protein n=1 Tax=Favolaschia claudopus TaxID=2862362 RepID=A0AAW0E2F0_9AGAR